MRSVLGICMKQVSHQIKKSGTRGEIWVETEIWKPPEYNN